MSNGPWKNVCSLSGYRIHVLDRANLPEGMLTKDGGINPAYFPDCDTFSINTFAYETGCSDPYYFAKKKLPSGIWHCHEVPMKDDDGNVFGVIRATHANSAQAGGQVWRNKVKAEEQNRARSMNFWTRSCGVSKNVTQV